MAEEKSSGLGKFGKGLAFVGDLILAAEGAHPGINDPDSTFSLGNLAGNKKGKGLGESATGSDALGQVTADLRDKEGRPKGSRSMNEILADKSGSEKKGKSKLAKAAAALGALGGGTLAPFVPLDYTPTTVAMTAVPYTGGRPTKTQAEYEKDLA